MSTDQEIEEALMGLMEGLTPAENALLDIDVEVSRQDQMWGDQSHLPNGTSAEKFEELANQAKLSGDRQHQAGLLTFSDIMIEEVYEALAEEDEEALETELIQVAAVATQWVLAIRARRDRRAEQD